MPWDKKRYPSTWIQIVADRHQLAGSQCEWIEWEAGQWVRCSRIHRELIEGSDGKRTILTLAHLGAPIPGNHGDPHDKTDVRPENLLLLCQRHHLLYDLPEHMANAKKTRRLKQRAKIEASGQLSFLEIAQ